MGPRMDHDLFISHGSEDKPDLVRPLADALRRANYLLWYDEFELKLGDSLIEKIDYGLANSQGGVIVLSPSFLSKKWPKRELAGLATRHIHRGARLIPIWHHVGLDDVIAFSPPLADLKAISSAIGLDEIVSAILRAAPPSRQHVSDATIEMALDYLEAGNIELAKWAASKALDERLHKLMQSCPDEHRPRPTGSLSALDALLRASRLRTSDAAGEIDLGPVRSLFGGFERFGMPDPEEQTAFVNLVQRLLRANPITPPTEA